MRFENKRAFKKHLEDASPNHCSPVYLIISKESYEIKECLDLTLHYLLQIDPSSNTQNDFAFCTFEGSQLLMENLLFELNSSSFFVKRQAVHVREVDKIKKSNGLDSLQRYLNKPHPSKYLILTTNSMRKDDALYKMVEKAGIILDVPEPKPWEKEKMCVEWLIQRASQAKKKLSFAGSQHLVKHLGVDQTLLENELEKLCCYIGQRNEITIQDIDLLCTRVSVDTIWQLGEAILQRESASSLSMARRILENSELIPFIRQLRSQFQTQYQIANLLAQGKQPSDITQEFTYMKGQILDRNIHTAKTYGLTSLREGLLLLDATEWQAKNSVDSPTLLIDLLIVKLTQNKPSRSHG